MRLYRDPLTPRQQEIYNFIYNFVEANNSAPTHKEIQEGLNMCSSSSIDRATRGLITKGWLWKIPKQTRGLRLVENDDDRATNTRKSAYRYNSSAD